MCRECCIYLFISQVISIFHFIIIVCWGCKLNYGQLVLKETWARKENLLAKVSWFLQEKFLQRHNKEILISHHYNEISFFISFFNIRPTVPHSFIWIFPTFAYSQKRFVNAEPHIWDAHVFSAHLLVPVPEDVLRGLGALLHYAGEVHGGALLDEDAGAAQDLGVRLCKETFTIYQNLQIPNFCKDLKTIFQHLFYINSVEIAVPRLHRILIFVKMFLIFLILFINKAGRLTN